MNENEILNSKLFKTFLDVLQSPVFPLVDYKLRKGINVLPVDYTLHSFISQAFVPLREYYSCLYLSLCLSNESVYYLLPQRRGQISVERFNELQMVTGLTIVAMDLEKQIGQDNWFMISQLLERMSHQLSESRLMELFRRRPGQQTQYDLTKIQDEIRKALVIFDRYAFIQLAKDKLSFQVTPAIYRFIEPLRGLQQESEIPQRLAELIQEGYLVNIDDSSQDESEGESIINNIFSAVAEIDTTGDLFTHEINEKGVS
ncbi:chromosome partition protein MukE [Photorhabdus bodei]|uniref:Bacterial condensin subunit MukE n=1 Tax=Photorhabdus aegyptia TaxID=2805098 RepID=A0A022PKM2_9GAMM|nr:chromosome partition protein MukE [Photorhabdus aegyptia]EYU15488.1 bacterial condensin subunit MukE [Photorhabdus aegyptia]